MFFKKSIFKKTSATDGESTILTPRRRPRRPKIDPRRLQDDLQELLFSTSFLSSILLRLGSDFCLMLASLWGAKFGGAPGLSNTKIAPNTHDGPRRFQDRLRGPQDRPRCPQEVPKTPPKTPQTPPKRPKIGPNHRNSIHPSPSSLIIFSLLLLSSSSLFLFFSLLYSLVFLCSSVLFLRSLVGLLSCRSSPSFLFLFFSLRSPFFALLWN